MRRNERITTITIAVAGVQSRIGTTTQAMQIVGYLKIMGYTVAYVDLTEKLYLEQIQKLYKGVSIKEGGKGILYNDIEMYSSISELKGETYDFLVKDYGNMKENFNRVSYLEQDIQIICCGAKPNEMFEIAESLKQEELKAAHYIFSFVPPDQKAGIVEAMGSRKERTYFAAYNPDPFVYDAAMNKCYRHLIGDYLSYASVSGGRRRNAGFSLNFIKRAMKWIKEMINGPGKAVLILGYTILLSVIWITVLT